MTNKSRICLVKLNDLAEKPKSEGILEWLLARNQDEYEQIVRRNLE